MPSNKRYENILIDARACLDGRPAAEILISGQPIVRRHLDLARRLGARKIAVLHADVPSESIKALPADILRYAEPPKENFMILDVLNIYKDSSAKVVWRMRHAGDAENAEGEIMRSEFFTISKYTLRPLGKWIAGICYRYTGLKANHLTLLRIFIGLIGACFFLVGGRCDLAAGVCVLTSWLLDLTDGQLARLRCETSKFGSYLDSVGDGVVDNLYYICIAWSGFRQTGSFLYIYAAIGFLFGKYIFVNSTLLLPASKPSAVKKESVQTPTQKSLVRRLAKKTFSVLDDTDVRIHFLAIAGALGFPVVVLAFHVVYFNLRWMLNLTNAYYKYEIKGEN